LKLNSIRNLVSMRGHSSIEPTKRHFFATRSIPAATAPRFAFIVKLRRGGGGRCDRYIYANGGITMLALGLVLNTLGIGLFCWLIFTLAVYALPLFVAVSAGIMAFDSGAGALGASFVGMAAGTLTLAICQTAFAMTRFLILRAGIGAAFALPAVFAGYHVVLVISQYPRSLGKSSSLASAPASLAVRRGCA
jgi:hypothetical protein